MDTKQEIEFSIESTTGGKVIVTAASPAEALDKYIKWYKRMTGARLNPDHFTVKIYRLINSSEVE